MSGPRRPSSSLKGVTATVAPEPSKPLRSISDITEEELCSFGNGRIALQYGLEANRFQEVILGTGWTMTDRGDVVVHQCLWLGAEPQVTMLISAGLLPVVRLLDAAEP